MKQLGRNLLPSVVEIAREEILVDPPRQVQEVSTMLRMRMTGYHILMMQQAKNIGIMLKLVKRRGHNKKKIFLYFLNRRIVFIIIN